MAPNACQGLQFQGALPVAGGRTGEAIDCGGWNDPLGTAALGLFPHITRPVAHPHQLAKL